MTRSYRLAIAEAPSLADDLRLYRRRIDLVPYGEDARGVDLIFALALLATLFMLARRWRTFWDRDFTADDRRLATQAAVFVVPPFVVLVHELGHVAGAGLVGGRVLDFHYGLIEGSVTVAGRLSAVEHWFVAIAGNVAGCVLGAAMAVVGTAGTRLPRPLRHLLILGGLLQVGLHLVLYPLLSISARFGDWPVVYDFSATPALSTATAVAHVAALAATWLWWRGRVRRALFHVDHGLEREVAALQAESAAAPHDPEPVIRLAVLYASNGEMSLARATLDAAAARPGLTGSGAARLHLARARMAVLQSRWNQAYVAAREGLAAAGDDDEWSDLTQRLWANVGLALSSMDRPEQALAAFDRLRAPLAEDPRILYARGLAHLACGDRLRGEGDLRSVVGWRPEGDLLRQWAEAQLEGREPPPPDDRDRPAYARRTKAPPAPIAGV
jgi:tetratricopeptide (TPR) repeat protein